MRLSLLVIGVSLSVPLAVPRGFFALRSMAMWAGADESTAALIAIESMLGLIIGLILLVAAIKSRLAGDE